MFAQHDLLRMDEKDNILKPPVNKALLAEIVMRLKNSLDLVKVILFGSYAYGIPDKNSDLDLLVVLNTTQKGIKRYAMISKLLEPRRIPVDILVKTPQELGEQLADFNPFLSEILEKGKVLYESS